MNSILDNHIKEFKSTGQCYFTGDGYISSYSEFNLWMGVRSYHYEVSISPEVKTCKYLIFEQKYEVYNCNVRITDTYNFNSNADAGDGLGSILNNFAFDLNRRGIGHDYKWEASYSTTRGERPNFLDILFVFL